MALILLRFGEISLKSPRIRRQFSKALVNNIQRMFMSASIECLTWEEWGRIFIETNDFPKAAALLERAFGVVSFSEVIQVDCVQGDIDRAVLGLAREMLRPGSRFAVRCRRVGNHPFTSQEMAAKVGEAILDANPQLGLKVDLTDPEVMIELEIRDKKAYIYHTRRQGPGGMPLSTQGGVLAIIEPGDLRDVARTASAFYLVMKRGCKVFPLCLYPEGRGGDEEEGLLRVLRRFDPDIRMRYMAEERDPNKALSDFIKKDGGGSVWVSARGLQECLFDIKATVFYPLIGLEGHYLDQLFSKVMTG